MDIEKIDIYPTLGLCMTLPKSIPTLNRAVLWVKQEVLQLNYEAYYDLSSQQRHQIGTYTSLEKAVKARNDYEIGLVDSGVVKGILMELARFMRVRVS